MPQSTPLRRSDRLKTSRMLSATAGKAASGLGANGANKPSHIFHGEAPACDVGVADERLSLPSAMLAIVGLSSLGLVSC
jgi:hypothetical protein